MKNILWIGILSIGCAACSQGFEVTTAQKASEAAVETPAPAPTPPHAAVDVGLNICSQLDFSSVSWPSAFGDSEKRAMALALNITGSFEGVGGWSNLANNFDGQGISLGLNQQNLGQGTLQPIFKKMLTENPGTAKALFSPANLKSLSQMVSTWAASPLIETAALSESRPLFPEEAALSSLDIGYEPLVTASASRNSVSVSWAVSNLYQKDGSTFKTDWKQSLKSFAATAPYRSLQIQASADMFDRAESYFSGFGFHELRALLLMYDFVVQNGGFNSSHLAAFKAYDEANPKASETARMLKLLEIRLTSVRPQYRGDVDSRKRAIITGKGRVHSTNRDLQKEYCYLSSDEMILSPVISQP